ncbi:X-Pro dipeptidyl-peptidase domain protein [uncultured Mycobacterium sp.]|uniref:X-Pro dipeptidyl-peptidase domain protein n=1 Tax=uncultured Mycobacterium sp. TaxID=171292 RepID=A0A1Y5P776_9MYCO|nr:X-Pro dipeptidyl-peptidase domain protein [uncultured Mycobacterium sp.]
MGASRFVGRVGGLAVALGVGAALFSTGVGVAWADTSTGSSAGSGNSSTASSSGAGSKTSSHSTASSKRSGTAGSGQAVGTGGAKTGSRHSNSTSGQSQTAAVSSSGGSGSAEVTANNAPSASAQSLSATPIATRLTTAVHDAFDQLSGGLPTVPADSPLALAFAALQRRESAAARSVTSALTTASLTLSNPITINQSLGIFDGIYNGSTGATTTSSNPLTYTLISGPSAGGKITFSASDDTNYVLGNFSYLPNQSILASGSETFKILVAEKTQFDKIIESIPLLGGLAGQVIVVLHQTPVLGDLLAPVIGYSQVVTFVPNPSADNPLGDPLAFTYKMPSFDGTLISLNWFPASTQGPNGVPAGDLAPTILNGPGLATAGQTDPYTPFGISGLTPGVQSLRNQGYNVVTWDPRGEFASGGILQLDSPAFEGRDVTAMINWIATQPTSDLNGPNDPKVGMVGGSYGGGIQLVSAGTDSRIDAIVPGIAWNSLNQALYPDGAFKTAYSSLLLLSLVLSNARINNQIYLGVISGLLTGFLSNTAQAVLASSGPDFVVGNISAPTLFEQGTIDVLFTLQQAIQNAEALAPGVPAQMIWSCTGHGVCLTPDTTGTRNLDAALNWLDKYVKGAVVPDAPNFQYTDQFGNWFKSDYLPTEGSQFFGSNFTAATGAAGGTLGLVPIVGGSGPAPQASIPYSLGLASKARNAINVNLDLTGLDQTVGAPTLTFDYQGLGTSRYVYAQLVDNNTGLVVGNLVTPVAVTLDGRSHSVSVNMENIVYTSDDPVTPGDLTLQITSSATAYENFTAFGVINISNIGLTLQTPATVTPEP